MVLSVTLIGCSEDDNPVEAEQVTPDEPGSLILEGNVYIDTSGLSLKFIQECYPSDRPFALGVINQNGDFRIAAPVPNSNLLFSSVTKIKDAYNYSGDLYISDTTASYVIGKPILYLKDKKYAEIAWYNKPPVQYDSASSEYTETEYYYFDKPASIKGTLKNLFRDGYTITYDIDVKAGWNRINCNRFYDFNYDDNFDNDITRYTYTNETISSEGFYTCSYILIITPDGKKLIKN
jgi:hypothetical protein